MKKSFHNLIATAAVLCTPLMTLAHPGHGHENPLSPGHYVANPEHSLPVLLTLAAGIAFAWYLNKKANRVNEK